MGCVVICLKNEVCQILKLCSSLESVRKWHGYPCGIVDMIICVVLTFLEKGYSRRTNDITVLVLVSYEFLYARSANSALSISGQTKPNRKRNTCY